MPWLAAAIKGPRGGPLAALDATNGRK